MTNKKISFVGLGGMGSGVVKNLVAKSNCPVTVFDLDESKVEAVVDECRLSRAGDTICGGSHDLHTHAC